MVKNFFETIQSDCEVDELEETSGLYFLVGLEQCRSISSSVSDP